MDKLTDTINSDTSSSLNFFKYVFNFDEENKNGMMNMIQYTILSIIPVLITLRLIKQIIPEEDETKGSLEIVLESVGQIILIILAIWFTNKIIRFIPTYSGEAYSKFNEINFIIPFIIILATMQTKLGAKLNILIDRVIELWQGKKEAPAKGQQQGGQGQNVVRVTQPFSGQHQPSQADYLDAGQLLPSNRQLSAMPNMGQQQNPDFNSMYNNNPTPMPGAAHPGGMGMMSEPVAANSGGGWGSPW